MPKPTALHAVTTSTLRRGEAITPVPTHSANPHNFRPLFTSEQLASSLRANYYAAPVTRAAIIMDTERLYADITTGQLRRSIWTETLRYCDTIRHPFFGSQYAMDQDRRRSPSVFGML